MSVKAKMDKLKRVLSGQDNDDEQNIVTQASVNGLDNVFVGSDENAGRGGAAGLQPSSGRNTSIHHGIKSV